MKILISTLLFALIASAAQAQNCSFIVEGKVLSPVYPATEPLSVGLKATAGTQYSILNEDTGLAANKIAYAEVELKRLVKVETKKGSCKGREGEEAYSAIDVVTYAALAEAASQEPLFTTAVAKTTGSKAKAWGICREQVFRACL